jgi:DNA repair protein RecN (Recombination protein N)
MLCELRIKNLALIESLELNFDQNCTGGLVVMTGETGAGKSIMLRAIHLLTGGRASLDWVRSGADLCEIEALFELNLKHYKLLQKLEEGGFGAEPVVVIKRTITSSGRSRLYVNGSIATARTVSGLASDMLSVAGQHDHQQLLQPALHLDFLDTLGEHWDERVVLGDLYDQWQEKKGQLLRLRAEEQEKEQKRDFLKFQVNEIREADLEIGEDESLAAEKKRLKSGDILIKVSRESYRLLSVELMDGLVRMRQNMDQLADLDPTAEKLAENLRNYSYLAEDYVQELREYKDSLEMDPFRLEVVNERLDLIQQLKRKYGQSLDQILEFAAKGELELESLDNLDKRISALQDEVAVLEQEVCRAADHLSLKRNQTALQMEKAMQQELHSLAFNQARFYVKWREVERVSETLRVTGWDRGEFFFCGNPGEPPKPLAKVASGGELSRLMLALKCLLARKDMVETVIFDEVDAGIGGEAAEAVARKIKELATHHQVFCITHLPQIAARGTLHFQVSKEVGGGRTQSAVVRLSHTSRVKELVRMLAGDSATEQAEAWAEELLIAGGAVS